MSPAGSESATSTTVSKPIGITARVRAANAIQFRWGMGLHRRGKTGNVAADGAMKPDSGMTEHAEVREHPPPVCGIRAEELSRASWIQRFTEERNDISVTA